MYRFMERVAGSEIQLDIWDEDGIVEYKKFAEHYKLWSLARGDDHITLRFPAYDNPNRRMLFKLQFGE